MARKSQKNGGDYYGARKIKDDLYPRVEKAGRMHARG